MTNRASYDVIIIGAGPGGSTLATRLAKAGFNILLLDKAKFPRYKVCGGGLTLRATKLLGLDIGPVIRDRINNMEMSLNGKSAHTFTYHTPFIYMVMRDELDQLLMEYAVQAGADFRDLHTFQKVEFTENGVRVATNQGEFSGKYLVGADGVHSVVAKQLKLMEKREVALALEYEMQVDDALLDHYQGKVAVDYGFIREGYAWVFPKGNHLSVGIGGSTKDGIFLQQKLSEYIKRENLKGSCFSQKGFLLSSGGYGQPLVKDRAALIGDAAGLVDSYTGEGMYYAIWSAKLLAETLLEHSNDRENVLGYYQERVNAEILPELELLQKVSSFFYAHPKMMHQGFIRFPDIVNQCFRVINGEITYADLFQRYIEDHFLIKSIWKFPTSLAAIKEYLPK